MAFYNKSISAFLFSLLISSVCLVKSIKNGGITIDLIHRDSPQSPSYDPSMTRSQRIRNAVNRSVSRKSSLSLASSSRLQDFETPIIANGGEYLMTVNIGTPPVALLAIADTGSDLAWTQCAPCTSCYKQDAPFFDPTKTTTYRTVSCESDQCAATGSSSCDSNNGCQYQVQYGDRSYSNGELAADTFTFASSEQNLTFPKVAFGCGHENAGTFNAGGTGIIGLGGGSISIINQLQSSIGGKFSYCLTLLDSKVPSKISFGSNAIVAGSNVVSTPIVKKSPDTFYYLTLEGVSVGTERLAYNSNIKQAAADEGNIIIDSGTTLTFLPPDLYQGLESAVVNAVNSTRVTDPQQLFNLCYQLPSDGQFSAPPITAHFTGADVVLPQANTFLEVEQGIVCLTLVPTNDLAIFGNVNQMNFQIGYDLVKQEVSFLPTDCTKFK